MYPPYQQPLYPPPPPPPRSSNTALVIVVIVAAVLAIGGGGCLFCVGTAMLVSHDDGPSASASAVTSAPAPPSIAADASPSRAPGLASPSPPAKALPAKPAGPPASKGPRVVDFTCPPGQPPQGVVRAGCLCGSEILGSACGPGTGFSDLQPTARGCRFTCP